MTDKILEMAKEAGLIESITQLESIKKEQPEYVAELEAFANLIRADERKQCMKIVANTQIRIRREIVKHIKKRGE